MRNLRKLEFEEKNKAGKAAIILTLGEKEEKQLEQIQMQIEELLQMDEVPPAEKNSRCKKCSYYEYCYI